MKKTFLGILLLISISSYADSDSIKTDTTTLKKALIFDLEKSYFFDCVSETSQTLNSNRKSQVIDILNGSRTSVRLDYSHGQPVIIAEYKTSETERTEFLFRTTSDFKMTTKVLIHSYEIIKTYEIIEGTLIEPKIRTEKLTKTYFKEACDIKH